MLGTAWDQSPVDVSAFIERHVASRYGSAHSAALTAWQLLARGVYQQPDSPSQAYQQPGPPTTQAVGEWDPVFWGTSVSLLELRPSLRLAMNNRCMTTAFCFARRKNSLRGSSGMIMNRPGHLDTGIRWRGSIFLFLQWVQANRSVVRPR